VKAEAALERVRSICLALPEAVEDERSVGRPVWKVRGKLFAMRHTVHADERWSLWVKGEPGLQEALVAATPERYFVPPYVGHHGWIGVYLDVDQDWDELAGLIEDSYCRTAPKRLAARLAPEPPR
jgi:hypothetical protein